MPSPLVQASFAALRALCVLLLLASGLAAAQGETLRVGPTQADIVRLEPYTTWLHDPGGNLSLTEIRTRAEAGEFRRLPQGRSTFGYLDGALWFRLDIESTATAPERWLLAIEYALLDHLTLFQRAPDGHIDERQSGDRLPYSTRDYKLRNLNFALDLEPGQHHEIYLRVVSQSSMQVPMALARPDAYLQSLLPSHIGLGLYYGIQLGLLLYNLILWLSVRDRNFLWYVLYAASLGLLVLCLNGLAFEFLWPDWPDWANLAIPLGIATSNLCMLQFTRSFLELRRHAPRADRVLLGAMVAAGLPLLAAWVLPYRTVIQYQTVLALMLAPAILFCALLCLRAYAPARHFLLAWSALLLGVVVYAAVSLGLLPKVPLTEFSLQIGSAAEMILLSFALAYRINVLKADNERIQSEAREHLEARVRARTAELDATMYRLEDANRRLQDFSRRDGLTGVYNRRHLDDQIVVHCLQARERVQPLSLLMIDVDHFKQVNDRHGHLVGDDCLRAVAQVIERRSREANGIAARYGGEEFALLLPTTTVAAASELAETLRRDIEAMRIKNGDTTLELSASVGVYGVPAGYPVSPAELLRHADSALYTAKRGGRNRVEVSPLV